VGSDNSLVGAITSLEASAAGTKGETLAGSAGAIGLWTSYALNDKLERVVFPLFYRDRERFIDVMRHAIALNGSFFNAQRMMLEYVTKAYVR
jgi:hypothetical protein